MEKVLVIAAHPDDEILGCGGSIIEHIKQKDKVGIIIAAEGITSRDNSRNIKKREKEVQKLHFVSKKIAKNLKVNFIEFLQLPDNRLDSLDLLDLVKKIEKIIIKFKPKTIYTHHSGDLNIDHRLINNATITACRPYPGQTVEKVLTFEIPSSTNWAEAQKESTFIPNYYREITKSLKNKIKFLSMYKDEMRRWPHARSIKAVESLAHYRGSTIGVKSAEAFQVVRYIKKN
jgi:LmbE family N-acetylglucosaminyl deacetylase